MVHDDRGIGETSPALETRDGSGTGAHALAMRWVFPEQGRRTDPLVRPVLLGRDPECGCHLPGEETSRRHASIRPVGDVLVLVDLGSRNGVFVNGDRVTEVPLARGDVVRLGEWVGVVGVITPGIPGMAGSDDTTEVAPGLFAGPVLRPILDVARRVATASDLPIILEGETGTGKECVAAAIHRWSGRPGRFVGINCAAIPEQLAEAELFGHRRGAFTGAEKAGEGFFRAAHNGTLLLDEIVDLPLPLQAKLLRVLQEREVTPLGETGAVQVDVRAIAAAQSPLDEEVAAGRLRADLYARLNGITIRLPPLRERREEVPALFREIAVRVGAPSSWRMSPRFVERLCMHDWPFNVRELERLVRRLAALQGGEPLLRRSHLPESMVRRRPSDPAPETPDIRNDVTARDESGSPAASASPEDLTAALAVALRTHRGNVSKAAAALGISRQRAYRLLEASGLIELDALREGARRSSGKDDD